MGEAGAHHHVRRSRRRQRALSVIKLEWRLWTGAHLTFSGPVNFGGFENLKMEVVRGQIFQAMGAEVKGTKSPVRGGDREKSLVQPGQVARYT